MNCLRMRANRRLKPTARQAKFLCARGLACALGQELQRGEHDEQRTGRT